jgi:hypothetical protein
LTVPRKNSGGFQRPKGLVTYILAVCRAEIARSELISSKLIGDMTLCILPMGDVERLTLCRVSLWHQPLNDTLGKSHSYNEEDFFDIY